MIFNIKRDMQFPHFCESCLTGIEETSPDLRYCPECYEFLLEEAKNYQGKQRWAPSTPKKHKSKPLQRVTKATNEGNGKKQY